MKKLRIIILSLLLAVLLFAGIESAFAQYPLVTNVSPLYQEVSTYPWQAKWNQSISSGDSPFDISILWGDGTNWYEYINQPYWSYTWYRSYFVPAGTKYQTFKTEDNYGEVVYKYTSVKVIK